MYRDDCDFAAVDVSTLRAYAAQTGAASVTTALTLYEIADEYRAAAQQLADLDLDPQTVADTLEGMAGALEVKALSVAAFVRNLEATADAIKQAEAQMAARRKALEARAESVREYLFANMLRCEISEITSPYFTLKIKDNPPKVVVDILESVPFDFMREPEPKPAEPDKKAIGAVLKSGGTVPGCHLEQTQRLEIK